MANLLKISKLLRKSTAREKARLLVMSRARLWIEKLIRLASSRSSRTLRREKSLSVSYLRL